MGSQPQGVLAEEGGVVVGSKVALAEHDLVAGAEEGVELGGLQDRL